MSWYPGGKTPGRARFSSFPWLTLFCLLALAGSVSAQSARSGAATPSAVPGSKYYVWGQVRSPGAYSFIATPDIPELLSAAGGPTEHANLQRVIYIQSITQNRSRIDVQAMLASGQVVRLAPGDVVIVPTSAWANVRDWLSVVTTASALVTLILTIANRVGT